MSMRGVLLDTNVASFLMRSSPEGERYRRRIQQRPTWLSIISVGELRYGALKDKWGDSRRSELEVFIAGATVLSVSDEIASTVALVVNRRRIEGRRIDWNDAWIAATADVAV
jgi:predicted nucleic acid-binding protein